jgi:signal transduction histidine kinase
MSEFARTLITSFSLQSNLDRLVGRIVEVLPATSAGITLISPGLAPRYVAASDDCALRYEQIQTEHREGPCLLAYHSGDAVAVPDVRAETRFPRFCPAAAEEGLGAVFTFPLRHGDGRLGALDIYRNTPGGFDDDDMLAGQTLADVVAACLTVRSAPVGSTDAELWDHLGVLEGVTERRAQESARTNSEELHRSVMETIAEGVYVLSADGQVIGSNAAAQRLLNRPSGDLREVVFLREDGTSFAMSQLPAEFARRESATPTEMIVGVEDAVHGPRWLASASQPLVREGERSPWATLCTIRDVTEQREVDRMKSEFVGLVSHEMRTPLTSIKGALGLVAAGSAGQLTAPAQHMIDIAATNTDRLIRLVNDMLDLERIGSGQIWMIRAEADLSDLVRQSVATMEQVAATAGVLIACDDAASLRVRVDSDRIIQTITNVLSNAVKFSPVGATVTLTTEEQANHVAVLVRVVDHGRGIPPELAEDVFARFHQVDTSDSRDRGGTGLGLAICKGIVEEHGGRIWIEPTPGGGATCVFTLPLLRISENALLDVSMQAS